MKGPFFYSFVCILVGDCPGFDVVVFFSESGIEMSLDITGNLERIILFLIIKILNVLRCCSYLFL